MFVLQEQSERVRHVEGGGPQPPHPHHRHGQRLQQVLRAAGARRPHGEGELPPPLRSTPFSSGNSHAGAASGLEVQDDSRQASCQSVAGLHLSCWGAGEVILMPGQRCVWSHGSVRFLLHAISQSIAAGSTPVLKQEWPCLFCCSSSGSLHGLICRRLCTRCACWSCQQRNIVLNRAFEFVPMHTLPANRLSHLLFVGLHDHKTFFQHQQVSTGSV